MELDFLLIDGSRMAATHDAWMKDANEGLAFPSEIERLLEWTATHQEPSSHDAAAFGVFQKGKNVALGICEVIIQRRSARSKWVKMLRLHLKPSVDAKLQASQPDDAMDVFVASIHGSLGLQLAHSATTLKVYGRTNAQLSFLKALVGHVDKRFNQSPDSPIKVTIDGRFLSIVVVS